MNDALGDRIKGYEQLETNDRFLPNVPIYARIDGRCFSRFTKGMNRPFDAVMHSVMVGVTNYLVAETNAILGYTQSDEISLGWYNPTPNGQIFFNGRKFKMVGSLAAMASVEFYRLARQNWEEKTDRMRPTFDARVFQVPSMAELSNAFLWRQLDCLKNAVSMAASSCYSHKELQGRNSNEKQEMLFQKGINFNDYPDSFKSGTFVRRERVERPITQEEFDKMPGGHKVDVGTMVTRSAYNNFHIPRISALEDPVQELFMAL